MLFLDTYDTYLFDLDGLLINTESTHCKAYERTCQKRGYTVTWTFEEYVSMSHYSSTAVRDYLYSTFPGLQQEAPDWKTIHAEKTVEVLNLYEEGCVSFMPGAEDFLRWTLAQGKPVAVVTNSLKSLTDVIKGHLPLLKEVPIWITRECYSNPKPAPDGYLLAYEKMGHGKRVVAFEDSPRGVEALLQTSIQPVLISEFLYPEIVRFQRDGVYHFTSFHELMRICNLDQKEPLGRSSGGTLHPAAAIE